MQHLVEPLTLCSCINASLEKAITLVNSTITDRSKLIQMAEEFLIHNATCKTRKGVKACEAVGGSCRTIVDGMYIEVGFCLLLLHLCLQKKTCLPPMLLSMSPFDECVDYSPPGVPMGLLASVPYILITNGTVNYAHQATFSWASWPFSLKLAWAPIVDAVYYRPLGRRKSWLLPVHYALALDFFILGAFVDGWLGRPVGDPWGPLGTTGDVRIWLLTIACFGLQFLAATHDIVVDGWALTMLSQENVSWASTCNMAGQATGFIFGFVLFLIFESPKLCNTYFRSVPVPGKGFISFSGCLWYCGALFAVSATLVAIFKRDESATGWKWKWKWKALSRTRSALEFNKKEPEREFIAPDNPLDVTEERQSETLARGDAGAMSVETASEVPPESLSLWQTYWMMLKLLLHTPILKYIALMSIVKFCLSGDTAFRFKIVDQGFTKENMFLVSSAILPLGTILPVFLARWSNGPRPLEVFLNAAIPSAFLTIASVMLIHYVDYFKIETPRTPELLSNSTVSGSSNVIFSTTFFFIYVALCIIVRILTYVMTVCQVAFHARISDPAIGGTSMTLLNTLSNFAREWPETLMLWLVEPLTWRYCDNASLEKAIILVNSTTTNRSRLMQLAEEFLLHNATCKTRKGVKACEAVGGSCRTIVDGMYIEVGFCLLVGIVFYFTLLRRTAKSLDSLPVKAYRLGQKSQSHEPSELSKSLK
ncbi:hypothetical protein Aperf_G00000058796 [Anoplocephala perfoliata]